MAEASLVSTRAGLCLPRQSSGQADMLSCELRERALHPFSACLRHLTLHAISSKILKGRTPTWAWGSPRKRGGCKPATLYLGLGLGLGLGLYFLLFHSGSDTHNMGRQWRELVEVRPTPDSTAMKSGESPSARCNTDPVSTKCCELCSSLLDHGPVSTRHRFRYGLRKTSEIHSSDLDGGR